MRPTSVSQLQASRVAACGLISGALLGLSFPPIDWSLLAWVALAPLGFVFSSPKMTKHSWAGVYLGGLFFHLLVLDWMRTLYGGVGLQGSFASGWLIFGHLGAILFSLMVVAGRRGVLSAKLPVTIVIPLVWMGYEYLLGHITTLFDQNDAQLVSLAHTQADHAIVAQIADLGGAGLISLLVAATSGFLYDATKWILSTSQTERQWLHGARLLPVPIVLAAVLVYGQICLDQNNSGPGPTVCLMGKYDLPPLLDKSRIRGAGNLSATESTSSRPELLVWPELAYHHVLVAPNESPAALAALNEACPLANGNIRAYSQTVRQYLEEAATEFQVGMLIGGERIESRGDEVQCYNCLTYVDPVFGIRGLYDKRHLAPFSEFTPAAGRWLQIANRKNYEHGQQVTPFEFHPPGGDQEYHLGCALCYDVAFPEHFRQQQESGDLDFFVVSGSETADSTGCMSQLLLRMAQLRAIETRRPIVRNTHLGYSGLIDANGQVIQLNNREELRGPWMIGAVPLDNRVSLYSHLGDWLSPTCFGLLLALLMKPTVDSTRLKYYRTRLNAENQLPSRLNQMFSKARRQAFSLLELMAVVAIIGTISVLLIPRVSVSADAAKAASNSLNRAQINAAVERWYLEKSLWPANNLSDLGADQDYFPDGIPTNPETGAAYTLNATTHRVIVSGGGGGGK